MALDVYKEWLGIPEGDRPPDHYELLRLVRFEDDPEKVRKHYQKLNAHVRKYATGQYSQESQDLLNELARAMLCLTDVERKREYDESLGREFEAETDLLGRMPLGDFLVAEGHITRDQLKEAESFADARGLYLRDAVVQLKLVDSETASQGYAKELGLSYVNLSETVPDDSVLDRVPRASVKQHQMIPLFLEDDAVLVACAFEPSPELEEEMRMRFDVPMRAVIATPLAVNQAISQYYAPGMRDEAVAPPSGDGKAAGPKKKAAKEKPAKEKAAKASRPKTQLPAEERRQRRMLGIILMCWVFVGAGLLDNFVVAPLMGWAASYVLMLTVGPIAAFLIYLAYVK